jgi:hypothetical protein
MHSLTELNNYSITSIEYNDERPASYTTVPNINAYPTSQTIYGDEGSTHKLPIPVIFTDITASDGMTLTVNVAGHTGANVSWGTLPESAIASNPSTGIYILSNIMTLGRWNSIISSNPTIYLGPDVSGNVNYTANLSISSDLTDKFSWTVTAVLNDFTEINTSSLSTFYYIQDHISPPLTSFNSGLQITDTENPSGTYQVRLLHTPLNTGTFVSNGSGTATSSYTANVLTISGVKSSVNSHLANISFLPATTAILSNISCTYEVKNLSSNTYSYATQTGVSYGFGSDVANLGLSRTYPLDQASYGTPLFPYDIPYIDEVTAFPYISDANTKLLLTCNSATGLTDSSPDGVSPSTQANVVLATQYNSRLQSDLRYLPAERKYGDSCLKFNSITSDAILSYSGANRSSYGTAWTIECSFKINGVGNNMSSTRGTPSIFKLLPHNIEFDGVKFIIPLSNGSTWSGTYQLSLPDRLRRYSPLYVAGPTAWEHIAISYNNGMFYFYADGELIGQYSYTLNLPTGASATGGLQLGYKLNGYMDGIRFSNVARYTGESISQFKEPIYSVNYSVTTSTWASGASPPRPSSLGPAIISTSVYSNNSYSFGGVNWNNTTNSYTGPVGYMDYNNLVAYHDIYIAVEPTYTSPVNVTVTQYKNNEFQLLKTFIVTGQ